MARRDDMEPIGGFGKASVASASEPPRRPRAWLTKRVMIVEREPLYDDGQGKTIGQLVDAELDRFHESIANYPPDSTPPVMHAVTVEFPAD